jgi:hypothetical protein
MRADLELIARCLELQEAHIAAAIEERASTRALLDRLAEVSTPNSGAAKTLLVYARLATTACDWIDGDLGVDLVDDGGGTLVETSTELGGGLRERLFPPLRFDAPLEEFARAIARVPHMIAPLTMRSSTARRIRLSASEVVRRTTAPPPPMAIAEESLFVLLPAAVPRSLEPRVEAEDDAPPGLPLVERGRAVVPPPEPATNRPPPPAAPPPAGLASPSEPPINDVDGGWDD